MTTPLNIGSTGGLHPSQRSGADRIESDQADAANNASNANEAPSTQRESDEAVQPVEDRVEISKLGHSQSHDEEARRLRELAFARKALLGIPPLTEERVEELRERLRDQYHQQTEVVREISDKMASALAGEQTIRGDDTTASPDA